MKDPTGAIRTWLFGVLNGTISYSGSVVPVYSFAPKDQTMPYMLIAEQSATREDGTKNDYISRHNVTLEIYSTHSGNDASYVPVNTIADSALQLIRTRNTVSMTGYTVVAVTFDGALTGTIDNDTSIVIYKIININLIIAEN